MKDKTVIKNLKIAMDGAMRDYKKNPSAFNFSKLTIAMNAYQIYVKQ